MSLKDTYADIADLNLSGWGANADRIAEHLTYIGDVDLSEPDYSFHLLRFYVRKADGVVLYGTDSGCSCPSPFEDTKVSELAETNLAGVERVAREHASPDGWGGVATVDVVAAVRALVPEMREAGAR